MQSVRDYYLVLGVPRNVSSQGIRDAYRDLAMRYHPDRAGARAMRLFQQIVEAHYTLADAERRAAYDQGLRHSVENLRELASVPIAAMATTGGSIVPRHLALMRDFVVRSPTLEEVLQRFLRNFTGQPVPKSEKLESLAVEIALSPDQAARGGSLSIGVPVFYPCPSCRGSGVELASRCPWCAGSGLTEEECPVRLYLTPGVRDGALVEVPLRGLGIHNLFLSVTLRVVSGPKRHAGLAAEASRAG